MKNIRFTMLPKMFLVLLALLFGAQDCDDLLEDKNSAPPLPANMIEGALVVTGVDSVFSEGGETMVTLSLQTPDPCWKYYRYEAKRDGDVTHVKVFGKREKEAMCVQMIGSIRTTLAMPVDEARIRFWQSENSSLDTTISRP